jgi:hypothetical protein
MNPARDRSGPVQRMIMVSRMVTVENWVPVTDDAASRTPANFPLLGAAGPGRSHTRTLTSEHAGPAGVTVIRLAYESS